MKAYDKGYGAFINGNVVNPYEDDSYDYREWERGFNKAYFYNLERVNGWKNKKTSPVRGRGQEVSGE